MKETVENVGQELVAKAEAMALAELGRNLRADHDFTMREGKDISRGGVAEMALVQPAALTGRDENNAELSGETPSADLG